MLLMILGYKVIYWLSLTIQIKLSIWICRISLIKGNVKTLPADQAVDDYAIATDGSAITYKSGKDLLYIMKTKNIIYLKIAQVSS